MTSTHRFIRETLSKQAPGLSPYACLLGARQPCCTWQHFMTSCGCRCCRRSCRPPLVSHTVPCCVVEAKRPSTFDHGVCQAILQVLDMQSRCAVASVSSPPVCPSPPPTPVIPGGGPQGGSGGVDALCESLALVALDESLPSGGGDVPPSTTEASAGSLRGGPPASKLCARHGGQSFGMSFIHRSSLVSRACI